jgi:hypothetical protein
MFFWLLDTQVDGDNTNIIVPIENKDNFDLLFTFVVDSWSFVLYPN